MYRHFFGLKESPFRLVPNPAYLFLSRSHEEALAHLTYAINHGDGFVLITGEVGTGKTTLCRAFLDHLDETTEAAYIFNPRLNSLQLLKTINDEFGIDSQGDNTKDLLDVLNVFLMGKKASGKQVILLIDEAQNLTKPVLEQLRLLSNLETNVSKLLQIILVGQPELAEMIASYELRQLGQRITLSCVLSPLNAGECREYVQHRIHVASQGPSIRFTKGAFRAIYSYSKGIPRRINIICDRALLTAYGMNRHRVTGPIVRSAARELSARIHGKTALRTRKITGSIILSGLGIIFILVLAYPPVFIPSKTISSTRGAKKAISPSPSPVMDPISTAGSVATPEIRNDANAADVPATVSPDSPIKPLSWRLPQFLKQKSLTTSRKDALQAALGLWGADTNLDSHLEVIEKDMEYFRIAARQKGFLITQTDCDLQKIKHLNLPVILGFRTPGEGFRGYLAMSKFEDNVATLTLDHTDRIEASEEELRSFCAGAIYIPWRNFYACTGTIPMGGDSNSIITLKLILKEIGFDDIDIDGVYDKGTEDAIRALQQKHQIPVDGIVGDLTKIILYNDIENLNIPHLTDSL